MSPGQQAAFTGHAAHICIPNTFEAKGELRAPYQPGLQSKNVSKQVNKCQPASLQVSTQESSAVGLLMSHFSHSWGYIPYQPVDTTWRTFKYKNQRVLMRGKWRRRNQVRSQDEVGITRDKGRQTGVAAHTSNPRNIWEAVISGSLNSRPVWAT